MKGQFEEKTKYKTRSPRIHETIHEQTAFVIAERRKKKNKRFYDAEQLINSAGRFPPAECPSLEEEVMPMG